MSIAEMYARRAALIAQAEEIESEMDRVAALKMRPSCGSQSRAYAGRQEVAAMHAEVASLERQIRDAEEQI